MNSIYDDHSVVDPEKHMMCEPCNSKLLGGFDPDKKEVRSSVIAPVL